MSLLPKEHLFSYSFEDLKKWCLDKKLPSYLTTQVFEWIYKKNVFSFSSMTNIKKEIQLLFETEFSLSLLKLVDHQISQDKETEKFLFQLEDKSYIESVLILSENRATLCISSQVGCPVGCRFCASGKMGFFRNLKAHEIISQLMQVRSYRESLGKRVTNIVFMGMGEPLLNLENVIDAIRIFQEPKGVGISLRRITLSTVGIIEKIDQLMESELPINLALSLHAALQETREELIPAAKNNPIDMLMEKVEEYFSRTKRDVTLEYTLIEGINDRQEDRKALIQLLRGKRHFSLNFIPFNPIEGMDWKRPEKKSLFRFRTELLNENIPTTFRFTKGVDIDAACGQLAYKNKKEQEK